MTSTRTVTCPDCGAEWDAATAGFCGRCGALLDSPAAPHRHIGPRGRTHGDDADGAGRRLEVAGPVAIVVVLAALVSGAIVFRGDGSSDPLDQEAVAVPSEAPSGLRVPPAEPDVLPSGPGPVCTRAGAPLPDCVARLIDDPELTRTLLIPVGDLLVGALGSTLIGVGPSGDVRYRVDVVFDDPRLEVVPERRGAPPLLLLSSRDGTAVVDPVDGRIRWSMPGEGVLGPASAVDRLILTASTSFDPTASVTVTAREVEDAMVRWQVDLPAVSDDGARRDTLQAFAAGGGILVERSFANAATRMLVDPTTGQTIWSGNGSGVTGSADDDTLILWDLPWLGSADGPGPERARTVVLDARSGEERWSVQDEGLAAGDLVLTMGIGRIDAREASDGSVRWSAPASAWPAISVPGTDAFRVRSAEVGTDPIVLVSRRRTLRRIDRDTGTELWSTRLSWTPWQVMVHGTRVYAFGGGDQPGGDAHYGVFDAATGTELVTVTNADVGIFVLEPFLVYGPDRVYEIVVPSA